jgi:hypothetical protein
MKTLKITAAQLYVNKETKAESYVINVINEGKETAIWRSVKQFKADIKRSFGVEDVSQFDMSHLTGGQLTGNIIEVQAGDKYTVDVTDDKGKVTSEEREYKNDGLQVTDGFLSLERNFKQTAAVEYAKMMRDEMM